MQILGQEKSGRSGPDNSEGRLLSESEFKIFSDLIHEECGVCIGPEKRLFLESRLKRRLDDLGMKSPIEYYRLVKGQDGTSQEMAELLDILMICETSFFRNQPQFDLLTGTVLDEIGSRKERAGSRSLRVWSAGCSTGQEPYSITMDILETIPTVQTWTLRIFASDLSFTALERAQCGVYREDQVRGVTHRYLSKYFRREDGKYHISDEVKRRVVFDYHNLKHDNGLRGLDVIFCRNVMIYFTLEEQRRLVERFARCLQPGGYLFLGHAESMQSLSTRFAMIHCNKGICYRLNG
jgi:chemotaxis protein methyltransferase CheR